MAADRRIQAFSAKVRRQVRNDLNDKKERIVKEHRDCGKHQLCQWMRKKTENRSKASESKRTDKEEPETEDDRVRREMRELIEEAIEIDENMKPTEGKELFEKMVTVYGDIELSEQERKFLILGPRFPLMENLKEEIAAQDFLTGLTKVRWGRMGMEPE